MTLKEKILIIFKKSQEINIYKLSRELQISNTKIEAALEELKSENKINFSIKSPTFKIYQKIN